MLMSVPSLTSMPASAVVIACAVAGLLTVVAFLFSRQEPISRRRMLIAACVAVAFIAFMGVRMSAQSAMCYAGDIPIDPCRICKDLEPWSWEWIFLGCWGC